MYCIKVEEAFKHDYQKVTKRYPFVREELCAAVSELMEYGRVSEEYRPHRLLKRGGNYTGHMEFHLSDGLVDVLVLYMSHKTMNENSNRELMRTDSTDRSSQSQSM